MTRPLRNSRPLALPVALLGLVGLVGLLGLGGGSLRAEEQPATSESLTSKEQLEAQLKRLSAHTGNARVKLHNGVVGRVEATESTRAPTPAQSCCSGNLGKLADAVLRMLESIQDLEACYSREGREGAAAMTVLLTEEVKGYRRSLQSFADAPTPGDAATAMAAMTRGYNRIKTRLEDVEDCGSSDSGAP